ncbi:type II toxin-antitoxin system Phd/YefM family antitoxin [Candidatus Trichorickettsia mobilis]|uniref:type II toxin-antitoxin system Phd/YefM family antitoxin n=1 Tax=Candidatus Trichorickettsia mobilis TaxID=1346319 RepID=UPI00293117C8|nr:type II toxin-antitoxin system Phd/YefM family antitoxin [Candidatus Trichorickettsia mobilis]
MTYEILADIVASISELKKNPMATIKSANGEALAILNHNKPVCYCISPEIYEAMLDIIDDIVLAKIVREREGEEGIEVDINDL